MIKEDLDLLGIVSNKSLTVPFPNVPKEFSASFVKGVIDGDGWVGKEGYQMNVTSASLDFSEGLISVFLSWNLKSKITSTMGKNGNMIYRIWVNGKEELLKLSNIIYKNSSSEYMTQHSNNPYYTEDCRDSPMWKLEDGKLIHTKTSSRISFRTNISKSILKDLKIIAKENSTKVNFLLEDGLENLLAQEVILYCKATRPKDRIQYKTTYDIGLLASVKSFAKKNNLFINDVIEHSVQFIDFIKNKKLRGTGLK